MRPSSLGKDVFVEYSQRGVVVKAVELDGPAGVISQVLAGIDVVISCMTLRQMEEEMTLITAAHEAGVSRYVPSFFGPVCPPRGVMLAREMVRRIPIRCSPGRIMLRSPAKKCMTIEGEYARPC